MTSLAFLSPSRCVPDALASPLARALAGVDPEDVRDLSLDGKVEIRGDLDLVESRDGEELVRLSPRRGLLLVEGDPLETVEHLRARRLLAYDVTAALSGLAVEGERLLRRLTDLDLGSLPAAGGFARIAAILVRDEGERFRVYFPQELGHYVAEVVLDAIEGLVDRGQTPGPVGFGHGDYAEPDIDGTHNRETDQLGHGRGSDPGRGSDREGLA
jgi:hypothetical protein